MSLLVASLIVLGAATTAFVAVALVRRASRGVLSNPTRGTPMAIVVGTSFAVLLAFLMLAAFQTYNGAKTGAASERRYPHCPHSALGRALVSGLRGGSSTTRDGGPRRTAQGPRPADRRSGCGRLNRSADHQFPRPPVCAAHWRHPAERDAPRA